MSERRGAQFVVSLIAMGEFLGLPEGSTVVAISGDVAQQMYERTVTIVVEHPDLPIIAEASAPVKIAPTFAWCDQEGREILTDWGVRG